MRLSRDLTAAVVLTLAGVGTAQAGAICFGCERIDGAAGTYLGLHNPAATDVSTFNHTNMTDLGPSTPFVDYWVWDISQNDDGSVSADYSRFTAVDNFLAEVYADAGSNCPGGAPSISHTASNQTTRLDLKPTATISDDKGLKDAPLFYYSFTDPGTSPNPWAALLPPRMWALPIWIWLRRELSRTIIPAGFARCLSRMMRANTR